MNVGARRSQPGQRREPRKIITVSVKEDVHLKKAENAWKPSQRRDSPAEYPENIKTQVGAGACSRGFGVVRVLFCLFALVI